MVFLVVLIFVMILGISLFISTIVGNFQYRAKQHILKGTGISSSDINAGINNNFEKKHIEKFLSEHSEFTEESIKDLLKQYTVQIFNRNSINEFSQNVYEKMQKDSKLEKMQNMEFRRANISYYSNDKLNAIIVYTDNKDEYNVYLNCSILKNRIQLNRYQISKGAVVGF
ncbi:MAG TPA: hypothetical protein IAB70_05680 [Candidatus Merdicola faecigallinarum]|uniref:Uncharacterized protein n=1 Tax=Candidatus Merdicola faecigallinarum TaxID=2840862 RepID=A0A9D1S9N9_9FIRM|nr:hypothetical protein [Candidatus Merdicola faecigallinarum]